MPKALITGITGQDGSYLAELLLDKGYEVHGTVRRSSLPNTERIEGIRDQVHLHHADLTDATSLASVIALADPDEVYNLAALSDVAVSFVDPEFTGNVSGLGCTRLLDLCWQLKPDAKFYQAGSSEMFGTNPDIPTNEQARFQPASPYAAAKVYAHHMTAMYRWAYGMNARSAICFNHESPRRGADFVTRKITRGIAAIVAGKSDELRLGNLDACRDWGWAPDYVQAMWMMMQASPADYVIATGESHSVREFLDLAFAEVELDWHDYVKTDPMFYRPIDPPVLLGDASRAASDLGWKPNVSFPELVRLMVDADLEGNP